MTSSEYEEVHSRQIWWWRHQDVHRPDFGYRLSRRMFLWWIRLCRWRRLSCGCIAIWWWRQGDISGNRISCCWRMMMMKSYTSVVRSKSTDIIYAHDLVYKALMRLLRGACGIMLSCIFEISWWWISAGNGCDAELMFFPRPRVGAPLMAIVAEVWAVAQGSKNLPVSSPTCCINVWAPFLWYCISGGIFGQPGS